MRPVCLIIIDGFGVAPPGPGNARALAKMPTVARLEKEVPNVLMLASGRAVGLPEGQQGASEPGHLTLGRKPT
jgi:2,3-bisphosphoglycerate-independent phosphoglycerate mutase